MKSEHRKTAERRGRRSETWAALFLRLKGYRVLQTRAKTSVGEVDLIVARGRTVAFIEVKNRPTVEIAVRSISSQQQQRIVRAADVWLQKNRRFGNHDIRFDVIAITPNRLPVHIQDAWRPHSVRP